MYDGRIESLAHYQFKEILEIERVSYEMIKQSLDLQMNRNKIFQAGEGAGRSGSFFFFSHDDKFIIKTIPAHEKKMFLDVIDDYIVHIRSNPDSLLARIYGIFTIKTKYYSPVDIIIIKNAASGKQSLMKYHFDLKGSLVSRYTPFSPSVAVNVLEK